MLSEPGYWQKYYRGDQAELSFARRYSLSDRVRYYWPHPSVEQALARLFANLEAYPVPPTLLSQFMPVQYERLRLGYLPSEPQAWVRDYVSSALKPYLWACRLGE